MPSQSPKTPRGYLDSQKNRARNAAETTGVSTGELLRLHFHRRWIARVFHGGEASNWVLKGGQALLVRWPSARYSADIDLLSVEDTTDAAVDALKTAAALRLADHIWFSRLRTFEPLEPPFASDCAPWPDARMFPIEDHVAKKICAMYERHQAGGHPSTRYKDLVDLALFAVKSSISGKEIHEILHDEIARRRKRGMVVNPPAGVEARSAFLEGRSSQDRPRCPRSALRIPDTPRCARPGGRLRHPTFADGASGRTVAPRGTNLAVTPVSVVRLTTGFSPADVPPTPSRTARSMYENGSESAWPAQGVPGPYRSRGDRPRHRAG
ncbi:MAG TPA: nucleotidyl transferase AbiEii/AbiGii toxin family protein [Amycolatopsis sp.]|nr:nucleotidyl transferase AbiEii/AbiGii toxin family protein [Amycolatopsis sp.]